MILSPNNPPLNRKLKVVIWTDAPYSPNFLIILSFPEYFIFFIDPYHLSSLLAYYTCLKLKYYKYWYSLVYLGYRYKNPVSLTTGGSTLAVLAYFLSYAHPYGQQFKFNIETKQLLHKSIWLLLCLLHFGYNWYRFDWWYSGKFCPASEFSFSNLDCICWRGSAKQ